MVAEMVSYKRAEGRGTWTVGAGMGVLQWADEQAMVKSREGRLVVWRALVVALVKQRVAVILLVIAISDLALKASRSGLVASHVSQVRLAKEVVADQKGVEGAGVANRVGAVGEAVGWVVHLREV